MWRHLSLQLTPVGVDRGRVYDEYAHRRGEQWEGSGLESEKVTPPSSYSLLGRIRDRIMKVNHDPNNITRIRDELAVASRQIILLREVLLYLTESLDHYKIPPMTDDEYDIGSRRLYKVLDPTTMKNDIMLRCDDLKKLIEGANNVQMTLQLMSDQINSTSLENVFKSVESNTKFLVDASAANERASASLEVMQVRAAELRSGVGLGSCFVVWGAERGRVVVVAQPP